MTSKLQVTFLCLFLTALVTFILYRKRGKATRQNFVNTLARENLPSAEPEDWEVVNVKKEQNTEEAAASSNYIAVRLMAAKGSAYVGYELMQALLSAGLRYGSRNIFHYYEEDETDEKILFSLASAVEPGTFELSQMGSITCPGLTLFMEYSNNNQTNPLNILTLMLDTARQLCEDLGGQLLNDNLKPLTEHDVKKWRLQFESHEQQKDMGDLLTSFEN